MGATTVDQAALAFITLFVGGVLLVTLARRGGAKVERWLRKLLFGEESSAFLATQAEDSAIHAHLVAGEPAVPVKDLAEEVTSAHAAAARDAPTLQDAQQRMRALVPNEDVANLLAVLVRWTPRRHSLENKYQASFRTQASKNGYAGRIDEKPKVTWGLEGLDPTRTAYPDFLMGDLQGPDRRKVLLELKANLVSSSEVDRAMGQMLRYLLAWKRKGPAVLVVCGDASPEIRFLVRMYINTWRGVAKLPVTVYFKRDDVVSVEQLALMPSEAADDR